MLFKAMNEQDVSCSVCNAHGLMAGCSNSEDGAFVPELLNPKANEDRAMIMAEADAAARVDLLLICGNADNASNEFLSIALGVARTSAQTIVVSEADTTFLDSVALRNPPIFCRSATDAVVPGWVSRLTNSTDEKYLDVSAVDPDSHVDSLDTELITGVTDITLVESTKGLPPPPTSMVRPRRRVANVYISERQAQINRSTFINANFRFVLKPQYWQNFKPVTVRPDLQLKWEWIERVIMPVAADSTTDLDSQLFAESAILGVDYMIKDAESRNAHDIAIEDNARKEQGLISGNNSGNSMSESELDPATPPDTSAANQNSRHHQQEASEDDFHSGYADMPDVLEVKIRHSMESTITDEVRQQFKMLNHLPLRCDVLFVEPELKDLVSRKSIDKFRPQLAHRDKHHAARAR
ncbi:hypothetical protein GGH99_007164, partial [Coemansia sp. RSA 1285]